MPIFSSASVLSAVALFAPARQIGYVGSWLMIPFGPNAVRPRSDGAEYLIEIVFPPIETEVSAGGLGCCLWAIPKPAINMRASNVRFMFGSISRPTLSQDRA